MHGEFKASIGFGFDSKTNDFKVVRVVTLLDGVDLQKDRPVVEVYSLANGEWRTITTATPPVCILRDPEPQAFLNGALHWVALREEEDHKLHWFMFMFDLEDEVLHEILLLKHGDEEFAKTELLASVTVHKDSIAFLQRKYMFFSSGGVQTLWKMEEYGVVSSWGMVLILSLDGPGGGIPRAIGFKRNGKFVFEFNDRQQLSRELEIQEMKDYIVSYLSSLGGSYVESLVLLDKAANVAFTY